MTIHTSFLDQHLSKFALLLEDPTTVELIVNPDGVVWFEKIGVSHMVKWDRFSLTEDEVSNLATNICNELNASYSKDKPIISGAVKFKGNDLRVQVVGFGAVRMAASIVIRKDTKADLALDDISLLFGELKNLDHERQKRAAEVMELASADKIPEALRKCVEYRLNMIISGGTSSGKTTVARTLLKEIDANERIITIEDAPELVPPQNNKVELIAERKNESTRRTDLLLEATLRMRPDRIIVGELRGAEAVSFLKAINTGHGGSFTTLHAETARKAIDRLALMIDGEVQMGFETAQRYCQSSIDIVVQVGRHNGKRGVLEVYLPHLDLDSIIKKRNFDVIH